MLRILPILTGESPISLRVVDWFVTNYARVHQTVYKLAAQGEEAYFLVYPHYKAQLKAFSKRQFDPFCRRERVEFVYDGKNALETTVGQLNFFRWALLHGVLDYIESHLSEIEKDMNERLRGPLAKQQQQALPEKTRRSRTSVSNAVQPKVVQRHVMPIFVRFGSL